MFTKTTAFAAAIALSTTTAFAGGLSPEIIESPVTEDKMMVAGPSIEPGYIVLGVLAALLIAAAVSDNESDEEEEEPEEIIDSIDGGNSDLDG